MATDMSKPSKKPLVVMALGKIPSVDLLKEHLGLNTAPVNVKNAFRDITIQWRKTNIGSNSQPATDLTDWHSPVVQKDLYTLAENFLADKDNAEHFWSASRPWKYDSMLQYPDDKERVIELLVQLFFKQNRAFKNNSRYGPWVHKDLDPNSSREGSTPQQIASMDTASERDAETSSRKRRRSETIQNPLSPTSNFIDLSESFGSSPPLPWDHNLPPSRDIYDMPDEQAPNLEP
ncbi:hypothetical protein L207DRAFT_575866 [Hyaloscypha variabilis F]|uniref:Uncharacterized protein n=1 Tax=Hyaloscypha variabilis (strain UAMH 11265 / GT02V1 / F) TaxID=1149755 RepID=A0A2J6S8H0_HYAVF|nr:hypothetical protein L207DRAFT_575866 [Hyaloscypha variabilis F]